MISRMLVVASVAIALAVSGYSLVKVRAIPKIGVVDNTILIGNFSESIAAKRKLDDEKSAWESTIKSMQDSIKASVNRMAQQYDHAPKIRQVELQNELTRRNEEYANYLKAVQELKRKRETETLQPVLDKINIFVKNWGNEHGYDIIYGTAGGGVILAVDNKLDITGKILADLNALYGMPSENMDKNKNTATKKQASDSAVRSKDTGRIK